jgi:hypothetical protein
MVAVARQRIFNSLRILLLITVKAKSSNAIISIISCATTIKSVKELITRSSKYGNDKSYSYKSVI